MSEPAKLHTKVLPVDPNSIQFSDDGLSVTFTDDISKNSINEAADLLRTTPHAIGFPTETVYGLGASSLNSESVRSIYSAKNRPADNPLISHVASVEQLERTLLAPNQHIPDIYKPLIDKFWPGPLTILLPNLKDSPISPLVTSGQPTFAVRIPSNPVARALLHVCDLPLAAPSANASTRPSPTTAQHVYHDLNGKIPLILDGGPCHVGLESTVVDGLCDPPMLLRPGGVSVEEIREVGGEKWKNIVIAKKTAGKLEPVRTPGMKYRHYSPTAKVVLFLNCGDGRQRVGEYISKNDWNGLKVALLRTNTFAPASEISEIFTKDQLLGSNGDEIQRNLFAALRGLDGEGFDYIFVEGVEESDRGLAIMNRLSKAATITIDERKTSEASLSES